MAKGRPRIANCGARHRRLALLLLWRNAGWRRTVRGLNHSATAIGCIRLHALGEATLGRNYSGIGTHCRLAPSYVRELRSLLLACAHAHGVTQTRRSARCARKHNMISFAVVAASKDFFRMWRDRFRAQSCGRKRRSHTNMPHVVSLVVVHAGGRRTRGRPSRRAAGGHRDRQIERPRGGVAKGPVDEEQRIPRKMRRPSQ